MATRPPAYFGAIPFRALADRRLGDLDVRTLGVIAAHDRMALLRGGQGCWAGTDRIATLANANMTNVSTAITKLESLGYLKRGPHPHDGRRSTFYVIYDATLDRAAFKGDVLPTGKGSPRTPHESTLQPDGELLCPTSSIGGGNQPDQYSKISEDTLNRPSPERAPIGIGARLAMLERHLKKGATIGENLVAELLELASDPDSYDDKDINRAQRIVETYFPERPSDHPDCKR